MIEDILRMEAKQAERPKTLRAPKESTSSLGCIDGEQVPSSDLVTRPNGDARYSIVLVLVLANKRLKFRRPISCAQHKSRLKLP